MKKISINDFKANTGVGFGGSGVRALVTDLTDEVVYAYAMVFINYLKIIDDVKDRIALAGDLRNSTPRIMRVIGKAIIDSGLEIINGGFIPTPAITYYGITNQIPSIMVTGSHIPDDRNGIKFNKSKGEILKADEEAIGAMEVEFETDSFQTELPVVTVEPREMYKQRYSKMFADNCLANIRIGLYGHSAVGRDLVEEVLSGFGAKVTKLGYSDIFVAVDTEVVGEETVRLGKEWGESKQFDALVSIDGDSDRPLLGDENGNWLRSDILGIITAKYLKADAVVTPITCNTAVDKCGYFSKIVKSKINSPFTIAEMMRLIDQGYKRVVGYEANGGFLTQELPTRDALTPILCWLVSTKTQNKTISALLDELPKRYTESDSVKNFPTDKSLKIIEDSQTIKLVENKFGKIKEINSLDGLRMTMINEEIIHLRPSKNAPEFRNYVEADSPTRAKDLSNEVHDMIQEWNQ